MFRERAIQLIGVGVAAELRAVQASEEVCARRDRLRECAPMSTEKKVAGTGLALGGRTPPARTCDAHQRRPCMSSVPRVAGGRPGPADAGDSAGVAGHGAANDHLSHRRHHGPSEARAIACPSAPECPPMMRVQPTNVVENVKPVTRLCRTQIRVQGPGPGRRDRLPRPTFIQQPQGVSL